MKTITVATISTGAPELLTREAKDALVKARVRVLRTGRHPVAAWLEERSLPYETLDALYDDFQPDNPYRHLDYARIAVQRGDYAGAMEALDRLEAAGGRGAVLTLLYHGLTESEWLALPSTRRFREHLIALREAGFTFLSPMDVPEYLARNAGPAGLGEAKPWLARQVDRARYAVTGERKGREPEEIRPAKVVAITFDDGLRSSFSLGTPIAQATTMPGGKSSSVSSMRFT